MPFLMELQLARQGPVTTHLAKPETLHRTKSLLLKREWEGKTKQFIFIEELSALWFGTTAWVPTAAF